MKSKNKELLDQFVGMTGGSEKQAQRFLEKARYNLQNALNLYYDEGCEPEYEQKSQIAEVEALFKKYGKEGGDNRLFLDDEGLTHLFDILKIDLANPVIGHLMINIMQMEKAEEARKEHLYNLLKYTRSSSFQELSGKIRGLEDQLNENPHLHKKMYDSFLNFYSVTKSPTLDFQTAQQLWEVYLKGVMRFHKQFMEYLETMSNKPPKIHKDLWKMVYQFANSIEKINDYNEEEGWPVFLDEFVEFLKKKEEMK